MRPELRPWIRRAAASGAAIVALLVAIAGIATAAGQDDRAAAEAMLKDVHPDELTPREREVLTHVIAGRLNKQIAADLGTVEKTIKVHRSRMMAKMGVRTVAELVRLTEKVSLRPRLPATDLA